MNKKITLAYLLGGIILSLGIALHSNKLEQTFNHADVPTQGETKKVFVSAKRALPGKASADDTEVDVFSYNIKRNEIENLRRQAVPSYDGWTMGNVNIRTNPSLDSEVIDVSDFNMYMAYTVYNEDWLEIEYNDEKAYISREYVADTECPFLLYDVPDNRGFKSYMSYKAITAKSSPQYKIQTQYAYTGNYGIRMVRDGRYCVAIGTAFNANVGDYADLILENGEIIPIVVSDIKSNRHTEANNMVTASNGCVSEYIVDTGALDAGAKRSGDISACQESWGSKVVQVKVYDKNLFD